jgi:hypothetical protein
MSFMGRRRCQKGQQTVEDCGAAAGSVLVGLGLNNGGLRVRVSQAQPRGDGGAIKGDFFILATGDNVHAEALRPLLGRATSAEEVVVAVPRRHPGSVNPVNVNILTPQPCDADGAAGQPGSRKTGYKSLGTKGGAWTPS